MEKTGSKPIDELVRLAMIGDGAAFTALWDTHIDALRTYLKSTMKTLDDFYVDDICSRSFEKAFRQIKTYDPSRSHFFTWLKTIAHNTALDIIEAEHRAGRETVSLDDNLQANIDTVTDAESDALDAIIHDEDESRTRAYVDGLPDLYREVARMRLIDGLQYKEIAEELGMELNTVRTRIRRAKDLIEKMKKDEHDA